MNGRNEKERDDDWLWFGMRESLETRELRDERLERRTLERERARGEINRE